MHNIVTIAAFAAGGLLVTGGPIHRGTAAGGSSSSPTASATVQIEPCKLLTKEQVATVLPNHDGGSVAHAGPSLIPGVSAYQCSYLNPDMGLFTVILNVAVDQERFADIKPSFSMTTVTKVPVADGGWMRGDSDDFKLTAAKGLTVIDLELMAPGADKKSAALVALGQAVAAKL